MRLGLAGRTAEPFQIEIDVPNCSRRRNFHVFNSLLGSASEPGLNPFILQIIGKSGSFELTDR